MSSPHTESPTEIRRAIQRGGVDSESIRLEVEAVDARVTVIEAWPAEGITADQITNWDTAYDWGDHAGLYDDLGTAAAAIVTHETTYDHDHYDTAYGWGDHSVAGYAADTDVVDINTLLEGGTAGQILVCDEVDYPAWTTYQHDALGGLENDDHPQYTLLTDLAATTQGHTCGSHMVGVPIVAGATVDNLHDFSNDFCSAGQRTGGVISDASGQTVNVTVGTGYLKATDVHTAELIALNWSAMNGIAIPTDTVKHIGVEWNGGSPQVTLRATFDFNFNTDFPLGLVINENDVLIVINDPWWVTDGLTNIIRRFDAFGNIVRSVQEGGLMLGTSGVRNVTLSTGVLWSRFNRIVISSIDTSLAGDFTLYYFNTGGCEIDIGETQYPVTHWNDITKASGLELIVMGANKYANWWVYILENGHFALIYPQAEHVNVANAEAESPPGLVPSYIAEHALLVGRIIFKVGIAAPIEVQSAFTTQFTAALAADHGNLAGLGGDDHTQYHTDARAATWLAANHETTYDHTDIWGAGAENQLWTQGAGGIPVSEASLTFNGTTLISPQYGTPDNIVLMPVGTGCIQAGSDPGNARGQYAVDLQLDRALVTQVANGNYSLVIGGRNNTASGEGAIVCGGIGNTATGIKSTIFGGDLNTVNSDYSAAGGGFSNTIESLNASSFVTGRANTIVNSTTYYAENTITGGKGNNIQGIRCVIGGGYFNDIASAAGIQYSTLGGGRVNHIHGDYGTISGGQSNAIETGTGTHNTITGGYNNSTVVATSYNGKNVLGGYVNSIQGEYCTIPGGYTNSIAVAAGVRFATISGGRENQIAANYCVIGGGQANVVSGMHGTISGGYTNNVSGGVSVIVGGQNNVASGGFATVLGGLSNVASGSLALASGYHANAERFGQSSHASGKFSTTGDAQTSDLIARKSTTDATPTELLLDGLSERLEIPVNTSWFFTIKVIARQTNDDFSVNAYHIEGTVSRDAGNVAIDYQATITSNEEDAAWDFVVSADAGNQSLKLLATGAVANNINWVAGIELVETTG